MSENALIRGGEVADADVMNAQLSDQIQENQKAEIATQDVTTSPGTFMGGGTAHTSSSSDVGTLSFVAAAAGVPGAPAFEVASAVAAFVGSIRAAKQKPSASSKDPLAAANNQRKSVSQKPKNSIEAKVFGQGMTAYTAKSLGNRHSRFGPLVMKDSATKKYSTDLEDKAVMTGMALNDNTFKGVQIPRVQNYTELQKTLAENMRIEAQGMETSASATQTLAPRDYHEIAKNSNNTREKQILNNVKAAQVLSAPPPAA